MRAIVLSTFLYSLDGMTEILVKKGTKRDIRDDLAPGLEMEGFIAPAPAVAPTGDDEENPGAVEIPANWRDLPWQELRALAAKVSPDPVGNKESCLAAIEAELARREQAARG
jgi:hypothetical protein